MFTMTLFKTKDINKNKENKNEGRRRCSCCNGLVRNKVKIFYSTNKLTTT